MNSLSPIAAQWGAIEGLLDQALDLPAAARAAWLDGLGTEAARHRDALRDLLARQAEIETDDFLETPPPLSSFDADGHAHGPSPGDAVGPYRLIEQVGAGGMGTVWLAERADQLIGRRVALKLPRVVWGDSFAERLARERELLATLEHPHIARLYDAGVDGAGRPFLAMEYVAGETLDAWCRTHAPSLRERVALLLQVLAAVGHAHSRLVVHRDLKPGNILVTADAQVKLLDFGVAKLLEGESTRRTALTELTGRALTPDYASPEQIRGEPLGTASDIYSMAVVAYEVLAGSRPYRLKGAGAAELEQAIAGTEPPPASDSARGLPVARELRGDVDAILNKALKKAPAERYATMEAFGQDLQRFLDGAPVQARPDGWGYRAAKFVHRYRLQVGAGTVVAIALVAGTGVALWQAREARVSAERARTEAARAGVEAATARAVQRFIESVFSANSRYQADPKAAAATSARELLDRGAERIDKDLAAEPEARLRLYDLLAQMYAGMSLNERSLDLYRRSLELSTRLHGPASDAALTAAVGAGSMLEDLNRHDEALATLSRADALAAGRPVDRDVARMNIDALLAHSLYNSDLAQGFFRARRAGAIARALGPSEDGINALTILGVLANEAGQPEEARQALVDAAAWVDRLGVIAVLPNILSSLAEVEDQLGRIGPAGATLARAVALAERIGDPQAVIANRYRLARFQYQNRLLHDAVATAGPESDRVRPLASDPNFFDLPAIVMVNYGRILVAYGDAAAGLAVLEEARVHLRQVPNRLAPLLAARADALVSLRRLPEAGVEIDRAVAMMPGTGDRIVDGVRAVRRRYWVAAGRAQDALQDFRANPPKTRGTASAAVVLQQKTEEATLLLATGRDLEARETAAGALGMIDRLPERRWAGDAQARLGAVVGETLLREGRIVEALPVLRQALATSLAAYDPVKSPAVAEARAAVAEAERRSGR